MDLAGITEVRFSFKASVAYTLHSEKGWEQRHKHGTAKVVKQQECLPSVLQVWIQI